MRGVQVRQRSSAVVVSVLASLLFLLGPADALRAQVGGSGLRAQQAGDTLPVHTIETIVVTADRAEGTVASSTASVSVLSGETLSYLPTRGLAGALQMLPGFAFLSFDGLGYAPQPMVRGFYGGGETDYVLLLLDGRPLNTLETGTLNWNLVPLSSIESIEVIRGGASSLYGDAAIGGVVNVLTKRPDDGGGSLSLAGGSLGSLSAKAQTSGQLGGKGFSAFGGLETSNGYRAHAERTFGSVSGSLRLVETAERSLTLSGLAHWRAFDDPGPLPGEALAESRTASAPFYRFDNTDEQTFQLGLDGQALLGTGALLRASLSGEHRSLDQVRTLPLTADFADTKARDLGTSNLSASVQTTLDSFLLDRDRLTFGVDARAGSLGNRYHAMVTGGPDAYEEANGERGDLDARGDGKRLSGAFFVQYDWRPTSAVRLLVGGRYDEIHDSYEPEIPEEDERSESNHSAFSPKAGINVQYASSGQHFGHLYANVTRSFKAPTLDQLYDQRTTPVPDPPFSATISNPDLTPQRGTSMEVGAYHRLQSSSGLFAAELTLSAYRMDMKDELDFDFASFGYVNVGRSRHDGIEAGLGLDFGGLVALSTNFTRQDVTTRAGDFSGNQLKAIPRNVVSAGITAVHPAGLSGSLTLVRNSGMYLDDANSIELADYTTVDGRVSWGGFNGVSVFAEAFNLLDETFSSTGFPDPAGSDVVFYHPAAGRTVRLGAEVGW